MKKIVIIGSSGAGKTTLARKLSKLLDIPHTELDSIYNQANWSAIERDEFIKQVSAITAKDEWILCGNYYSKLGKEVWQKADTVIWCDYPFATVFSRLIKRTMHRSFTRQELWNGNHESIKKSFFSKESIILWMLTSWQKQKKRYSKLFAEPSQFPNTQLVRLRNSRDTNDLLQQIR